MADDNQLEYEEEQTPEEQEAQDVAVSGDGSSDLPFKEGAVFGAGAFVVAYAVIYQIVSAAITMEGGAADNDPSTWVQASWTLLAAAGAALESGGEQIAYGMGEAVGVLLGLFLIGVVIAAGYAVAKHTGVTDDVTESVKAALTIVPGFAIPAIVLAVMATHTVGEDGPTIEIPTGDAVLYAGILLPVVFGVIGGVLAARTDAIDRVMKKIDG